jgi:hypothetical protein
MPAKRLPTVLLCAACLPGCVSSFFAGRELPDRSRPVAVVETTGGVEFGATTELGILTLGRTAQEGPCRVHYFLGPTPIVEDGTLAGTGSTFVLARIDLRTQHVRVLDRAPDGTDELLAMWTETGDDAREVPVQLLRVEGIDGDALADPGVELPAGAAIFARHDEGLRFVGLVTGKATLTAERTTTLYTYAGIDRMREMLAVPKPRLTQPRTRYRLDDIQVTEHR